MTQAYFDPKRASDPHALPDCEVFYLDAVQGAALDGSDVRDAGDGGAGWYWQACFPGCLPDGDPVGPFDSEADALADAQSGMEE